MSRTRLGAAALGVAGVMFILYPAIRPWHDETTAAGAAASLGSSAWVMSHFFAMVGFILASLGVLALRTVLAGTRSEPTAAGAVLATWTGAGLTLPYYGAEDFGLHGAAAQGVPDLLGYIEAVRFQPLAMTIFAAGLLLLAIGGILAAVAVWRSGVLPKAAGIAYAAGMVLFFPQFFTPPAARIGHGILLGAGAAILAVAMARASRNAAADAVTMDNRRAGMMAA